MAGEDKTVTQKKLIIEDDVGDPNVNRIIKEHEHHLLAAGIEKLHIEKRNDGIYIHAGNAKMKRDDGRTKLFYGDMRNAELAMQRLHDDLNMFTPLQIYRCNCVPSAVIPRKSESAPRQIPIDPPTIKPGP